MEKEGKEEKKIRRKNEETTIWFSAKEVRALSHEKLKCFSARASFFSLVRFLPLQSFRILARRRNSVAQMGCCFPKHEISRDAQVSDSMRLHFDQNFLDADSHDVPKTIAAEDIPTLVDQMKEMSFQGLQNPDARTLSSVLLSNCQPFVYRTWSGKDSSGEALLSLPQLCDQLINAKISDLRDDESLIAQVLQADVRDYLIMQCQRAETLDIVERFAEQNIQSAWCIGRFWIKTQIRNAPATACPVGNVLRFWVIIFVISDESLKTNTRFNVPDELSQLFRPRQTKQVNSKRPRVSRRSRTGRREEEDEDESGSSDSHRISDVSRRLLVDEDYEAN